MNRQERIARRETRAQSRIMYPPAKYSNFDVEVTKTEVYAGTVRVEASNIDRAIEMIDKQIKQKTLMPESVKNWRKISTKIENENLATEVKSASIKTRAQVLSEMRKVYDEFGIDLHQIPAGLQQQLNSLVREVIKLRKRK